MTMKKSILPVLLVCLLKVVCFSSDVVAAFLPSENNNNRQCPNPNVYITYFPSSPYDNSVTTSSTLRMKGGLSREDEIRRKIMKLKKQGMIKKNTSSSPSDGGPGSSASSGSYESKIKQKLGKRKSELLGFISEEDDEDDNEILQIQLELDADEEVDDEVDGDDEEDDNVGGGRQGRIGYLPELQQQKAARDEVGQQPPLTTTPITSSPNKPIIDPSLFKEEPPSDTPEMSEEELLEKVAAKLSEKRRSEEIAKNERLEEERKQKAAQEAEAAAASTSTEEEKGSNKNQQLTSGVGGNWAKDGDGTKEATTETYKPKSGSWGVFERPKSISKAYGGGRRIGPGYSKEENEASAMNTKRLLKEYRQKVGIDVPTEKEHANEIEEALQIGQLAMQRGVYATAVSALEKVTQWCSTNSPVGSKVYLELAMAYEAVGRAEEAVKVYQVLSKCRMEDVKYNAKRLLYGMEAMGLMREISSDFSRQKVKNTFVDATGLRDIAQNFDDRYNTAYVDLDNGFYKRLTESVVRSNREARQILLKATGKGEISRMRIVQALRSLARHFDDALEVEIETSRVQEPTAYIDGKPILSGGSTRSIGSPAEASIATDLDEFVLSNPDIMLESLQGTWTLQLLADKTGDGVSFFNTTTAIQEIASDLSYTATGPSGLVSTTLSGDISFEESKRIISRINTKNSGGGGFLGGIFGGGNDSGFAGAISRQQQIISVDSVLLITKSPTGSRKGRDSEKEHFAVWRKVSSSPSEEKPIISPDVRP